MADKVFLTGSVVKIYGELYYKVSDEEWSVHQYLHNYDEVEFNKFLKEFSEDEIEVIRKPDPSEMLGELPAGSIIAGGLYGEVARKVDVDEWTVSSRDWVHSDEDTLAVLSGDGDITVVYRGGES